jgi:translocator protein
VTRRGEGPGRIASDILALGLALAICFIAAGIGAMATPAPEIDPWYRDLARPAWTPPGAVFGIVWSGLYALMAVAAWLVWHRGRADPRARSALWPFGVQLMLNVAWPWAFFGLQSPAAGLLVIVLLAAALVLTVNRFARHSRLSAWLLAPYLAWVAFAFVLNATILAMNV